MFSRIITPLNLGLLALLLFAGTWLTAPLFASEMARPQRSGMVQVINLTATPSPTATPANTAPTYLTQWGSTGSGNGQFSSPVSVAADSSGNLYVTESTNNRVQKFTSDGVYLTQWGSLSIPFGIAVDSSDNVYVAEYNGSRITKFTSNGIYLTQWGTYGTGNGQFVGPNDVAVDSNGYVYVVDRHNNRIQKFDSNGTYLAQWGSSGNGNGQFSEPWGLAVDGSNNVYVADRGNSRIQKFTSNGAFLLKWGSNGELSFPRDLATDSAGNLYVTDSGNHRVQKFTNSGVYLTQFGTYGNANGQFNQPWGVAVDSSNAVYVVDYGNNRLQKFGQALATPTVTPTPTPTVTPSPSLTPSLTPSPSPTPTTNPNAVAVTLPTNATGAPGGTVTVPVQLSAAVTGQGIVAYEFRLTFDPAVLTPANVTTAGTLSDGWNLTVNINTPGALQVVAFNTTPLVGSGTLLNLLFNVVGPRGTSTALTWTNFVFNEGEPAAQTSDGFFAGVPVPVTLPTAATGATGTQVNIPVLLPETVDGLAIIAYEFSLAFDPAVLSVAGATTNGTLSNGWNISINSGTPGIAQVVAFNVAPLAGSGTLLNLVFNVTGAANSSTALTWTNFIFNEGAPMAQTSAGSFRVLAWQLGGAITYRTTPRAMGGVTLNLSGATANATTTNASGLYSFTIESEGAHTVTPSKSGAINGISAFDAAFVAQCVAGLRNLADCPLLAADTSGNNLLSAFDAAQIAQYAAGLAGPTSRVGRWVFSPASRTYATLTSNLTTENYGAYLVGEVSGNWQPPSVSVAAQTGDNPASGVMLVGGAGGTVTVQHDGGVADLLAYQITLHYDASLGTLVEVIPAAVSAAAGWELVANMRTPGVVTLVGYGATPLTGAGSLATLRFIAVDGQAMSLSPTIVAVQRNEAALWFTQELRYRHFLPWVGAE